MSNPSSIEKVRVFENLHIVFWLFKDMSWAMGWTWLGISMIAPTLFISFFITYKLRHDPREWYHNNAISLWIIANSLWMISEFFHFNEAVLFSSVKGVHLTLIPFVSGILILAYYYLFKQGTAPRNKHEA